MSGWLRVTKRTVEPTIRASTCVPSGLIVPSTFGLAGEVDEHVPGSRRGRAEPRFIAGHAAALEQDQRPLARDQQVGGRVAALVLAGQSREAVTFLVAVSMTRSVPPLTV